MPYNQYRGFSPAGQFAGMLGTSLSQILGGYLGAKIEQDKMQREYDSNRRILKARYPSLPEEQLDEYSQVSSRDLPQLMQGLGANQFQQVLSGGAPGAPQQPGMVPEQPGMMPQQPGMVPDQQLGQVLGPAGIEPQMDAQGPIGIGDPGVEQQQMIQQQPFMTQEEQEQAKTAEAANEMNRLNSIEESLSSSNLDPNQYMLVRKYLDDSKQAVKDSLLADQQLQMKIAEADRKRMLDEQKTALERAKFERKIITEDREHRRKQLEAEEKQQDRLYKQYGEQYNELVASKKSKLEDLKILSDIQKANSDPNVSFGSPIWNSFASFLTDKLGFPAKGLRATSGQVLEKQSADLLGRLVGDLKGSGIRAEKLIQAIAKKYPDLYQSYEARALVTEGELAKVKLDLQMIDEAQKLYEKNNHRFVPGFFDKVDKKMTPHYKKYFKARRTIPEKIKNDKALQAKQRAYERSRKGGLIGGITGVVGSTLLGAGAGGAAGGPVGAAIGGIGGLAKGLGTAVLGAGIGEQLANPAVEAAQSAARGYKSGLGEIYSSLGASPDYIANRTGSLSDRLTPEQVEELRRTAIQ